MPPRPSINQQVQIGVETTPGVATPANRLLQSISIEPSIKADVKTFRPVGGKFATVATLGKEWSEASISGTPTYTELVYLLSGVMNAAAPTTVETSARRWVFSPSQSAADTVRTYTVEQGSSVRAHRLSYGVITELGLTYTRSEIGLSGKLIGRQISDGVAMTASPAALALVPALAARTDVFLATTAAGLSGATALALPLSCQWTLADRFGPLWALNSANASWAAPVELAPKGSAKLKINADAEGMGPLASLRSGATVFMRIRTAGDLIATTATYLLQVDLSLKVTNVSDFSDEDGVFAVEWEFEWAHDAAWGRAVEITVQNLITSL